ncbi:hypothetical protein JW796_03900 [Candidatus Dojkabacteria bacterium]|nr:hypothetical protein [Candidatus Dojkabacteria bacterium]
MSGRTVFECANQQEEANLTFDLLMLDAAFLTMVYIRANPRKHRKWKVLEDQTL